MYLPVVNYVSITTKYRLVDVHLLPRLLFKLAMLLLQSNTLQTTQVMKKKKKRGQKSKSWKQYWTNMYYWYIVH